MGNDAIEREMSIVEGQRLVRAALKACEAYHCKGARLALAASPLSVTTLVTETLFPHEEPSSEVRSVALVAILRWAIDKIKPAGQEQLTDRRWRPYASLYYPHFTGETMSALAERMGLTTTDSIYEARESALTEVATMLVEEWRQPHQQSVRRGYVISERLRVMEPFQQMVLALLALLDHPITLGDLGRLLNAAGQPDQPTAAAMSAHLHRLVSSGWLVAIDANHVELQPTLRAHHLLFYDNNQAEQWRPRLAAYEAAAGNLLAAAEQWRLAKQPAQAAQLLVDHYATLVDSGQAAAFYQAQAQLKLDKVGPTATLWAQLKIAGGRAALLLGDRRAALQAFGEALGCPDPFYKAQAHYQRAKILERALYREALAGFDQGIALLQGEAEPQSAAVRALLAELYIGKAWLYLQVRPDLAQAQSNLQAAGALLQPAMTIEWAALQAAWAQWHGYQQDLNRELAARMTALLSAQESSNGEMRINQLFNLAQTHREVHEFEQAGYYLTQAEKESQAIGDQQRLAKCWQERGAIAFYQRDYQTALAHYQRAYAVYANNAADVYLGWCAYDLAEAYCCLAEWQAAHTYYNRALLVAQRTDTEKLQADLAALVQQYPLLRGAFTDRQRCALAEVAQQGFITNRRYQTLTGVSAKQAERDLRALVEQGVLLTTGAGRSWRYVQPPMN